MQRRQKQILIRGMAFLAALLLPAAVFGECFRVRAQETRIVYFFYDNPCASCDESEKIYELFREEFSEEERAALHYELRAVNVFERANYELYLRFCETAEADGEPANPSMELPVLICGDIRLVGYTAIREELRRVMEDPSWSTAVPAEEDTVLSGASSDASPELRQFMIELDSMQEDGETAILFVTASCGDCQKAEALLRKYPALPVRVFSILEPGCGEALQLLLEGQPEGERQVPCLFLGEEISSGGDACRDALLAWKGEYQTAAANSGNVNSGDANPGAAPRGEAETTAGILLRRLQSRSASAESLTESAAPGRAADIPWYALLAQGVAVGLNPCSVSMLLMLFSVLLASGKKIVSSAVMYLAGKFAAYALLGVVLFRAAAALTSGTVGRAGRALGIALAVVFAVLAVMNFRDAYFAFRRDFGRVRMQLPAGLRRAAHAAIRRLAGTERLLLPAAFLLGLVISAGEFFCAGQLYAASILSLARRENGLTGGGAAMFALYALGILLPSAGLTAVIAATGRLHGVTAFFAKHEAWIKLLTAVLFLVYAVIISA
ncbi:hypothetical protein [Lachnoclostridium sp. Marseille-P6806]|uniref:hypothetical protein n=1 Tax=Lachnoclostridium sp. Marseille-P6806 TaxID=2364793 RepID=UPI00102F51EE|nr:hypothetical protein [Lachnoclostridium sp. Marseille-P6806]